MYQETPGFPHNCGEVVKRKRGRPRKYPKPDDQVLRERGFGLASEELYSGEVSDRATIRGLGVRANGSKSAISDVAVGEEVYGVVEAAFGAGYLLAVKVGDSETTFRGVVFKPGNSIPVSQQNDVVPEIEMIRRSEVPFPSRKTEPERSKPFCTDDLPLNNQTAEACHTLMSSYQNPVMTSETQMLWSHQSTHRSPAWVGPSNPTSAQIWRESEAHVTRKHGRPFEKLLSEVIKSIEPPAGSAHQAAKGSGPGLEDDDAEEGEPLAVEPLRSLGLNKSAFMFKPVKDYRPAGKMTHLLQAVQENMRENKGFFD